jgi:hypothetical protein
VSAAVHRLRDTCRSDQCTQALVPGRSLPHPDPIPTPRTTASAHPPADLAEIVRLCGLPFWIERSYKQIKDELGWADFQVRSDIAIRRHQTLVNSAFTFCWNQVFVPPGALDATAAVYLPRRPAREGAQSHPASLNCPTGPGPYGPVRSWLTQQGPGKLTSSPLELT